MKMDKSQNPPHIPMDTTSTVPTQVSGQTTVMVSLDTNTLIAARQGAAWKISGWPENIAIHHAKGCACCHEYINHLLRAQNLGKSIYSILTLRMLYRAPGLRSSTALKLMLINAYKGNSVISMCRLMNQKTLLAMRRGHTAMRRLCSQKSTAG